MSLFCRNPSDSFSFSLRIKATLFTMVRKVLYDQDTLPPLFLLCLLLLLTLLQPHCPPCCSLSMPKYLWLLYVHSHCPGHFLSGHPHDSSLRCHLLQYVTHLPSLLHLMLLISSHFQKLFSWLPDTTSSWNYSYLTIHFWSLSWDAPPLSPL